MPQKNGVQVLQEIRDFYKQQQDNDNDIIIEEPVFVFLTAFMTAAFKKHLATLGVQHIYEKPIQKDQLNLIFEQNMWRGKSLLLLGCVHRE